MSNYPCGAEFDTSAPYNQDDAKMVTELTVQFRMEEGTEENVMLFEVMNRIADYLKTGDNDGLMISFEDVEDLE